MARRRRPGSRTSVAGRRPELIVPAASILDASGDALAFSGIGRWVPKAVEYPAKLPPASTSVSLVLDRFAYDLHLSDIGHTTDVHDGDPFVEAARDGVAVYVVDGVDPRRAKPADLQTAAHEGRLLGALVEAFEVDHLSE